MRKAIVIILALFLNCSTLNNFLDVSPRNNDAENRGDGIAFNITWDTEYKYPTDKKGYLLISNAKTGKQFKITYKDFFVWKKGYKNWRTVEKGKPIITDIEEEDNILKVTFNYISEDSKQSILSGKFLVDTKYIKNQSDLKKLRIYKSVIVGETIYSLLVTALVVVLAIF